MLLAMLLLLACDGGDADPTDEDTEVVPGTATRPIVEPVDSAQETDTGGSPVDTQEPTEVLEEFACDNGLDDDEDELVDCDDPDCAGTPDCSDETCGDGLDNDGNGLPDCLDPACEAEPACDTLCAEEVLMGTLPIIWEGSTSGQGNDSNPSCVSSSSAPDRAFAFITPADGNYAFSTAGSTFDTVLYLYNGCGGQEVACNDDAGGTTQSQVTGNLGAGQVVIVVVDGYSSNQGSFRLTVSN